MICPKPYSICLRGTIAGNEGMEMETAIMSLGFRVGFVEL